MTCRFENYEDGAAQWPRHGLMLRSHARRLHPLYVLDNAEVWGMSAFVAFDAVGPASYSSLLHDRLRSYPTIYAPPIERLAPRGVHLARDLSVDLISPWCCPRRTTLSGSTIASAC